MDVILYTRSGCCLCDEAKLLLEKYGMAVQEIDIDGDEQLRQLYNECVPVVSINGRERFRGRIDERLLRRERGDPVHQRRLHAGSAEVEEGPTRSARPGTRPRRA